MIWFLERWELVKIWFFLRVLHGRSRRIWKAIIKGQL